MKKVRKISIEVLVMDYISIVRSPQSGRIRDCLHAIKRGLNKYSRRTSQVHVSARRSAMNSADERKILLQNNCYSVCRIAAWRCAATRIRPLRSKLKRRSKTKKGNEESSGQEVLQRPCGLDRTFSLLIDSLSELSSSR